MDLLTKKKRPITHNLHQKYSKYLCKSVMREYLIFKGKNYRQHNNAPIKSLGLIVDSALKIPSKLFAAISFLDKSYKPTSLLEKEKQKEKQTKQLESYLTGFNSPL